MVNELTTYIIAIISYDTQLYSLTPSFSKVAERLLKDFQCNHRKKY